MKRRPEFWFLFLICSFISRSAEATFVTGGNISWGGGPLCNYGSPVDNFWIEGIMHKFGCTALGLFAWLTWHATLAAPFAYIPNSDDNNLWVVDLATGSVVSVVQTGVAPTGIAVNGSRNLVYVANEGSGSNNVSVISTTTNTRIATITIPVAPIGVAFNTTGTLAYVTGGGSVYVIDVATNNVIQTVGLGTRLYGIATEPSGRFAYIADYGANLIRVLDLSSYTLVANIAVSSQPFLIAFDPLGRFAYVSSQGAREISVINLAANTVSARIAVGEQPSGIAVSPNGSSVYVTNFLSNTVSIINTATNAVSRTLPVGAGPYGIAFDSSGLRAYVLNAYSNTMSLIDTSSQTVISQLPTGRTPTGFGQFVFAPTAVPPNTTPGTLTVSEFYHSAFNHYFMTGYTAEAASLAAGNLPPWTSTGQSFLAWNGAGTALGGTLVPMCRYFSNSRLSSQISTHFYSWQPVECPSLPPTTALNWTLEALNAFYVLPFAGSCPGGSTPLYRFYNNGMGGLPNHRYTTSVTVRSTMLQAGWIAEGRGPNGEFACVPSTP